MKHLFILVVTLIALPPSSQAGGFVGLIAGQSMPSDSSGLANAIVYGGEIAFGFTQQRRGSGGTFGLGAELLTSSQTERLTSIAGQIIFSSGVLMLAIKGGVLQQGSGTSAESDPMVGAKVGFDFRVSESFTLGAHGGMSFVDRSNTNINITDIVASMKIWFQK